MFPLGSPTPGYEVPQPYHSPAMNKEIPAKIQGSFLYEEPTANSDNVSACKSFQAQSHGHREIISRGFLRMQKVPSSALFHTLLYVL